MLKLNITKWYHTRDAKFMYSYDIIVIQGPVNPENESHYPVQFAPPSSAQHQQRHMRNNIQPRQNHTPTPAPARCQCAPTPDGTRPFLTAGCQRYSSLLSAAGFQARHLALDDELGRFRRVQYSYRFRGIYSAN